MKDKPQLFPGSPNLYHPHYVGEDRKTIRALARFPDGRLSEVDAPVDQLESSFLRDVFAQYDLEDLERNTEIERRLAEARDEVEKLRHEDKQRDDERAELHKAKSKTLEIPEVKACGDEEILSRIRKARSAAEVYSFAALALLKSQER